MRRASRAPSHPVPDHPPFNAFIGNLSFQTQEREIDQLFSALALDTIRLVRESDGRSKGFAYVEFVDRKSLEKALTFDGEMVNGRAIRVDVAESKEQPRKNAFGGFQKREEGRMNPFGAPRRQEPMRQPGIFFIEK